MSFSSALDILPVTFSLSMNDSHFAITLAGPRCYHQKRTNSFDWHTPACNPIKNLRFNANTHIIGTTSKLLIYFLDTVALFSFFVYLLFAHSSLFLS